MIAKKRISVTWSAATTLFLLLSLRCFSAFFAQVIKFLSELINDADAVVVALDFVKVPASVGAVLVFVSLLLSKDSVLTSGRKESFSEKSADSMMLLGLSLMALEILCDFIMGFFIGAYNLVIFDCVSMEDNETFSLVCVVPKVLLLLGYLLMIIVVRATHKTRESTDCYKDKAVRCALLPAVLIVLSMVLGFVMRMYFVMMTESYWDYQGVELTVLLSAIAFSALGMYLKNPDKYSSKEISVADYVKQQQLHSAPCNTVNPVDNEPEEILAPSSENVVLCDECETEISKSAALPAQEMDESAVNLLQSYKGLLDIGAITQQEYNKKKEELMQLNK